MEVVVDNGGWREVGWGRMGELNGREGIGVLDFDVGLMDMRM